MSVGSDVKVSQQVQGQEKVQDQVHVQEVKSMHDNFAKNIDVRPKEQGTSSGFYSPLVLNIIQKENVSFDELQSIQELDKKVE